MKAYKRKKSNDAPCFVVWDIESTNWFDVQCVVVMRENGTYFARKTVGEAVAEGVRRGWSTDKVPWFSHYGGIYDTLLAARDLLPRWQLERGIYNSGFGLWSADFTCGNVKVCFRDSSRLLPGSVASIGKSIDLPKLDVDRSHIEAYTWDQTVEYCVRDCEIVRRALLRLWSLLDEKGDTLSSRVTRRLRRIAVPDDAWAWNPSVDRAVSPAYHGGRVEVFRERQSPCASFDINSSYPYAMTQPLPTRFMGECSAWDDGEGIIDATVCARAWEYPVLPYRTNRGAMGGKLLFPSGEWRGMFTAPELRYAVACGAATIVKVHRFWAYETETWSAEFMEEQYGNRARMKAAKDEFGAYAYKIMLNSAYGKLVEKGEHEQWSTVEPADAPIENRREFHVATSDGGHCVVYGVTSSDPGAFRHVAAGAYVTAIARANLHTALAATRAAYCDTDAVYCAPGSAPEDIHPSRLGAFKPEGVYDWGEFLGPKLYALAKGDEVSVHTKGMRRPSNMTAIEFWNALKAGESIKRETTLSFVGQVRSGRIGPKRVTVSRQLRGSAPKRAPTGKGMTRPWTIREIMSL